MKLKTALTGIETKQGSQTVFIKLAFYTKMDHDGFQS